ncbi:hypothetical protein V496_00748 [Pseudogymnoascus sp. VKM F-4515 (FW-2607)]|nr:hypothetical protein V496_00748 [Pseudogymnoascus sp. VKM F-4515 (FW-2607)]KFY96331.1 hypothetical protein V498_02741 [Pseudogymnoascus sp. VKM F-4517 (FW-2822)]
MKLFYAVLTLGLYAAPTLADTAAYAYNCGGCGCNAQKSFGETSNGDCVDLPDSWSMGLSATNFGESLECRVYNAYGCQGDGQNMGIKSGNSWGCTNTQVGWIRSVTCQKKGHS